MSEYLVEYKNQTCIAYRCWHRLLQSFITPTLRKCGSSHEQGLANMFEKKGVILTSLKTGASLDDAETDGIEVS